MNAYLILRDIRPAQNRYRVYEIRIGSVRMQGQENYSVVLAWGRAGYQKRRQVFLLDSQEKVDRLLKPVLRTRYRHGYQLADKSRNFPHYPILEEFAAADSLPSKQLSLFAF